MQLIDFVQGVYEKNQYPKNFPPELELPREFAKHLRKLYHDGESCGQEFGRAVTYDSLNQSITLEPVAPGLATSCQIPRSGSVYEFADMHSHPSQSIGHVNGYSAHSIEDYLVFHHHQAKPLFIRFVSSGPWLYAVRIEVG